MKAEPRSNWRSVIFAAVVVAQIATVLAVVLVSGRLTEGAEAAHADELLNAAARESAELLERHVAPVEAIVTLSSRLAGTEPNAPLTRFDDAFLQAVRTIPQLSGMFVASADGDFSFVSRLDDGYRIKSIAFDGGVRTTQLTFLDAEGTITATELDPSDTFDPTERPWYTLARQSLDSVIWTDPYVFFTSQEIGITLASATERNGVPIVVGADIELGSLSEFLAGVPIGDNGGTLITNEAGVVIAHPDAALIQQPEGDGFATVNLTEIADSTAQAAVASRNGIATNDVSITYFDDPEFGISHVAVRSISVGADTWTVSVFGPRSDLVDDLRAARDNGRWLAAVIGTLAMLLFGFIAWKATHQVKVLEDKSTADDMVLERIVRIVESSHNEIYIFDAETLKFSLVNRAARTNLGYTMAELAELTPAAVSYQHDESSFDDVIERLRSEQVESVKFEAVAQRKDGTTYPVEIDLQLYGVADPPMFVAILQDITERTAAKQRLQFQRALLDSQSEASLDGILALSADGSWLNHNQRFLDMWGISAEEAAAATPGTAMSHELLRVADQHAFREFVDDLRDRPETSGSADFELLDGTMLEVHSAPIMADDGVFHGRLWQYRDITGRKLHEAEIVRHRDTLESLVARRTAELSTTNDRLVDEAAERRLLEAELTRQAHHDRLTGLPNRLNLERQFPDVLRQTERGGRVALVFMDLNGFKYVNDTLGHSAGDELLIQVGKRLQGVVRSRDTLVRLGGDEFALLINEATDTTCHHVLQRIIGTSDDPYMLDGHPFHIGMSIGVAHSKERAGAESFDDLLRRADLAMYRSKENGTDVSFYDADDDLRIQEWSWLERQLRQSIDDEQLVLAFQPILDIETGAVVQAEALLRWHHPERGLVMPNDFIPVAEETGFIVAIDRWVIAAATAQAAESGFAVSVNVAPRTLVSPDFVGFLETCLSDAGLAASQLHLELTERAIAHPETTQPILQALHDIGVSISIDDFGTGYSSLTYLQHYPLDTLKLDQSFMDQLGRDHKANAIAETVIRFAHSLGLIVVAEGVETEPQLDWLREHQCDQAQGYLFARPAAVVALTDFIEERTNASTRLLEPTPAI